MFRLICLDMDGTLLDDNKRISKKNAEAVKRAYQKGVIPVICTGRLFSYVSYVVEGLGISAPVICANGAYIKKENQEIYKAALGKDCSRLVLDILKENNIEPCFNTPDVVLSGKIANSSKAYVKMNETLPEDKKINIQMVSDWDLALDQYGGDILKCIAIDNDLDKVNRVKERLRKEGALEVQSSYTNNIEIMKKGVSKGNAVQILAEKLGIKRKDIICVGDGENDISMIKFAGLGVAMENGDERVKAAADFIAKNNNEDGVAEVIETFI